MEGDGLMWVVMWVMRGWWFLEIFRIKQTITIMITIIIRTSLSLYYHYYYH